MQTIYVSIKLGTWTLQNRVAINAEPGRFVAAAKSLRKSEADVQRVKPSELSWAIYTSPLQLDPVQTSENWPAVLREVAGLTK